MKHNTHFKEKILIKFNIKKSESVSNLGQNLMNVDIIVERVDFFPRRNINENEMMLIPNKHLVFVTERMRQKLRSETHIDHLQQTQISRIKDPQLGLKPSHQCLGEYFQICQLLGDSVVFELEV